MQLLMDLLTTSQKKAEMAVLDTALFYTMIIKKSLEPTVEEVAPLGTEPTLQVAAMVVAQATMLNILLAVER